MGDAIVTINDTGWALPRKSFLLQRITNLGGIMISQATRQGPRASTCPELTRTTFRLQAFGRSY